eukprot:SAG22_NODE_2038_length_3098_cov_1.624542_4_plen_57_part_00
MAVTLSGEVYAWEPGGGTPRLLPLFRTKRVNQLACCGDANLVVSAAAAVGLHPRCS